MMPCAAESKAGGHEGVRGGVAGRASRREPVTDFCYNFLMSPTILHTSTFARDAANLIIHEASEAIALRGTFFLGLCGGKTPESVYKELAKRGGELDWSKIIVTFGDERCVGPEHPDSNFKMTKEVLFDHVPIPLQNILRIHGEDTPDSAAAAYEKTVTGLTHDLLLLGMGDDGHTASLFPGTEALAVTDRLVVANFVPKFNTHRVTFTYLLINDSRKICFLVNDQKKTAVLKEVLKGNPTYPASRVAAKEEVTWLLGFPEK